MGIKAHYLQDKDKNKFYPYAHADASFDRNGIKVGKRLDDLDSSVITIETKLATVEENAEQNVQSDWNVTDVNSDAYIQNKPESLPADGGNSDTVNGHTVQADVPADAVFTDTVYEHPDSGVVAGTYRSVEVDVKGHVVKGENPNTLAGYGITDAEPKGAAATALSDAKSYTDTEISKLINGAPSTLDTLGEVATAMEENQDVVEALDTAIGTKANASDLTAHVEDKTIHIEASERADWNAAKTHADSAHARVDATNVDASETNGNVKINGIETPVYVHPDGTNPHGTTKSDVGLGNVPNVSTNDQTPTYTEEESLKKLTSGEKLSVAFGKISKAISDLISHISDNIRHITSTERSHYEDAYTHSTSDHAPSNAQVNQNAFSNIKVGDKTIEADLPTDTLEFVAGENISFTANTENDQIIISSTGGASYDHPTYAENPSGLYKIETDKMGHVSSATAVTKDDITALGIPESDTDTHYESKNVVGANTATDDSATALANGEVHLNSVENGAVTSSHKIIGSGATEVTTNENGDIVISSTDTDTKYDSLKNPYALTLQFNGVTEQIYDGSSAQTLDITPDAIGAAESMHTHDDKYYTETEIDTKLAGKAESNHEHNYAGSASAGGSANSAVKLDSSAGSASQPVYFSEGKPVVCNYTIEKSVPADAKFTDTWRGIQDNLESDSTTDSLSAAQGKALKALIDSKPVSSHTHDDRYYTESEIDAKLNGKADTLHTHNYAGSTAAGGSANSAVKLDSSAGSATKPVYFSGGKPVACTYTLEKSVPSNAVFTDTVYTPPVVKIGEATFDGSNNITLQEMGIKNPIEITKTEYEQLKASGSLDANTYYNIIDDFDPAALIDDTTISANQVFSSSKIDSSYSKKSVVVDTTLTVSGWTGSSVPYTYTLSVNGVTATNINEINYSSSATDAQIEAYQNALLKDGGQSSGKIILKAMGDKPMINIPITIIVRHDV